MIKTKKEILEEVFNKTLGNVVDSEIQIEYFKNEDPKMVVLREPTKVAGQMMMKEYTAQMVIDEQKIRLKRNIGIVKVISEMIDKERKRNEIPLTPKKVLDKFV